MSGDFKIRLYNFEVAPPENSWKQIESTLDEGAALSGLGDKMYNTEINPPANAWHKIESALNEEVVPVIPLRRKVTPFYKYAAAAAFIGILVFAFIFFLNNDNATGNAADQNSTVKTPGVIPDSPATPLPENPMPDHPTKTAITASVNRVSSTASFATHRSNKNSYIQHALAGSSPHDASPAELASDFSVDELQEKLDKLYSNSATLSYNGARANQTHRYATLFRPDGYIIRMSKKFADMIDCIYNSSTTDEECKTQIREWRAKMAKAPVTPSPDNFMDILTLIKSLQDN